MCSEYRDSSGRQVEWLTEDLLVKCTTDEGEYFEGEYLIILIYASVMFVVIVIGMPVFFWKRLNDWRYPFNRLYVVQEDGTEAPTRTAKWSLGKMVVYDTANWFWPCVDMLLKLLLSSMGVFFQKKQIFGACACWLICGAVAACFAIKKPFCYHAGNLLSVVSYVSLMGSYTEAVTDKLQADGSIKQR